MHQKSTICGMSINNKLLLNSKNEEATNSCHAIDESHRNDALLNKKYVPQGTTHFDQEPHQGLWR